LLQLPQPTCWPGRLPEFFSNELLSPVQTMETQQTIKHGEEEMKIKAMAKVGLAVLVFGMIFALAGTSLAQSSAASDSGSRFIQKFDKNGDGKVSQEEFPWPVEHFNELDTNGDGYIDATEAPKGPPHHGMMGGDFIQKFDKDADGKVSKEEFPGPAEHFNQLDANGDGYIDATEAPKGPPPMRGPGKGSMSN
jgi:hypothetical protein